ncbi:integrase core domain-containing protein [Nocardia ignorata]|uniref:integrase core domain-containing protein n=1 Tax=Nocardia ignorata TaxID=145285 RepID=UPI003643B241
MLSPEGRRRLVECSRTRPIAPETGVSRACAGHLGLNRRKFIDPSGADNRKSIATIVARHPGHMVHVDVKKVGRIPDGGGWRTHGRGSEHAETIGRGKKRATRTRKASQQPVYRSVVFARHQFIRPYTPRHNGKVERNNRILAEEFLYARDWTSETQRSEALAVWNVHCNYHRPHTAAGNRPPATRLHFGVTNVMASYS